MEVRHRVIFAMIILFCRSKHQQQLGVIQGNSSVLTHAVDMNEQVGDIKKAEKPEAQKMYEATFADWPGVS